MTNPPKLNSDNLHRFNSDIKRPEYDRSKLTPGIVHIGVGNFHRAHQAWYLHRLMQKELAGDWAIVGAGVRQFDAQQREKLVSQNILTTLIELDPAGKSAEIIGSMIDYVPVEEGNAPLIKQMAKPEIRIVSLTITEGAYFIDPETNGFDANHPDIIHDVKYPDTPRTAFGAIIAALKMRRQNNIGPFTGLCCDNLINNGRILRQTVVSLARLSDPELADWIDTSCSFPNTMVDCIVPATGMGELEFAREFGIDDSVPVTHENFRQWVVEDDFCAGRPDWDQVGATFSDDVHNYETMKLRILNGGHQMIANPGEILAMETIADCMNQSAIGEFFKKVALREITPHVPGVREISPINYVSQVEERFRNPEIRDTVRRVASDGSSRHSGFVIPVIQDAIATEAPIDGLVLAEALWARMCEGIREDGSIIDPNDANWSELKNTANRAKENPQAWLEQSKIYGDLARNERFSARFAYWLNRIHANGTREALKGYLES